MRRSGSAARRPASARRGFCVNGVCCDTACNGGCGACNLAGHARDVHARSRAGPSAARPRTAPATSPRPATARRSAARPTASRRRRPSAARPPTRATRPRPAPATSATCPADAKKANGTACTDDGNACTTDICNGTSIACQHAAGNAGTQCRAARRRLRPRRTCTGSSATCPANPFKPTGTVCRDDGNATCAETCTGSSVACHAPAATPVTASRPTTATSAPRYVRPASIDTCPAEPATAVRRAMPRVRPARVDVAENCTGAPATCPPTAFNVVVDRLPRVGRHLRRRRDLHRLVGGLPGDCARAAIHRLPRGGRPVRRRRRRAPARSAPARRPARVERHVVQRRQQLHQPDTCQSGSCTAGANTLRVDRGDRDGRQTRPQPELTATLAADAPSIAPGRPVGFTSTVTNTGTVLNAVGRPSTFTTPARRRSSVGGFQQTLEYQAVPSGVWTPFARVAYDAAGNVVPETTLLQLTFGVITLPGGSSDVTYPATPDRIRRPGRRSPPAETATGSGHRPALIPPDVVEHHLRSGAVERPPRGRQLRRAVRAARSGVDARSTTRA